jgi:hypothetical protein
MGDSCPFADEESAGGSASYSLPDPLADDIQVSSGARFKTHRRTAALRDRLILT